MIFKSKYYSSFTLLLTGLLQRGQLAPERGGQLRRNKHFVEGAGTSLDIAVYRNCYPEWTVIPRGSCESVIHSVITMRNNASLTRITCAGIVDADHYDTNEISNLKKYGIEVLPVCEIENLLILPGVARAIAENEGYVGAALDIKLQTFNDAIISNVQQGTNTEDCVVRYCRRSIDRILKKIDLSSAADVTSIAAKYIADTASLDIDKIANEHRFAITKCVGTKDIPHLMALYDNKGLVAEVAKHLKGSNQAGFENWIVRVLKNNSIPNIITALKEALPVISPI